MAMSVTTTEDPGGGLVKVKFMWVSAADGTATGTTAKAYNAQVMRAVFDPDAAATQPTDLYDVVVNDADGYDVLSGAGANLSNAANVYKTQNDGLACCTSKLTVSVSNAGDSKGGVVILYLLPLNIPG